ANGYRVLVRASDGRRNLHFLPARARRLVLPIAPFEAVTVSVRGEAGTGRRAGPARSARLRALRLRRRG
ncbi:MAG TPA: hypothetical protein VNB64_06545, partial [Solirubrobacteraceae bacterium]|nr:hypothetical protein [Solirubrobacteraceae bacterium]